MKHKKNHLKATLGSKTRNVNGVIIGQFLVSSLSNRVNSGRVDNVRLDGRFGVFMREQIKLQLSQSISANSVGARGIPRT